MAKKAAEEGRLPIIPKSTCVCKTCNQPGHNSRTCPVKVTAAFLDIYSKTINLHITSINPHITYIFTK